MVMLTAVKQVKTVGMVNISIVGRTRVHTTVIWLDISDGQNVNSSKYAPIIDNGRVVFEEMDGWSRVSINFAYQLHTLASLQTCRDIEA